MKSRATLAALCAVAVQLTAAADAVPELGNPEGIYYAALLPDNKGWLAATAGNDGIGVQFAVSLGGLPEEDGPYTYHIHNLPTPDGNCTLTEGHLDPYEHGSEDPCNWVKPESCEVGDLSGKHGKAESIPYVAAYIDLYPSLKTDSPSFFGERSFVVHNANGDRVTCANFKQRLPSCLAFGASAGYACPEDDGLPGHIGKDGSSATAAGMGQSATTTSGLPMFTGGAEGQYPSAILGALGLIAHVTLHMLRGS